MKQVLRSKYNMMDIYTEERVLLIAHSAIIKLVLNIVVLVTIVQMPFLCNCVITLCSESLITPLESQKYTRKDICSVLGSLLIISILNTQHKIIHHTGSN